MIKEINDKDLERALALVNNVFSEFVAVDYSEQGRNTFEDYLKHKNEEVASDLKSGHKKMWAYYRDNEIIGVISTRNTSHISLMFVDKNHHRQGIARELFNTVLEGLKKSGSVTQMTVNSSPYAVHVYERLGFNRTGPQQENDGIIFIPMAREL